LDVGWSSLCWEARKKVAEWLKPGNELSSKKNCNRQPSSFETQIAGLRMLKLLGDIWEWEAWCREPGGLRQNFILLENSYLQL
jgi:hypothetical protein